MAFLDKRKRIIDMVLTDRGRELLSTSQLTIKHYAFSDELIDYSGSLNQSLQQSSSMDDVVYRNFIPIAADQMNQTGLFRDLTSFLYTAPEQRDLLPQFTTNTPERNTLTRLFVDKQYEDFIFEDFNKTPDCDFVIVVEMDNTSLNDREKQYVAEQNLGRIETETSPLIVVSKK